jgi:hypothetical protein
MLKNIKINIKVTNKNLNHYRRFYPSVSSGDSISVNVIEIPTGSHVEVCGICDFCGKEKLISYKEYNKQTSFGSSQFTCSKECSLFKTEKTILSKYGKENLFQVDEIKQKSKETKLEKYGDSNYNNRVLSSKTCLCKYGVNHISKLNSVKEKKGDTNIKKFGFKYPSQNPNILKKMSESNMKRFGVDNFAKTDHFKEILRSRWFERMKNKLEPFGILSDISGDSYKIKCVLCGEDFEILTNLRNKRIRESVNICVKCNPKKQNIKQNEIFNFISIYYPNTISSDRNILKGKEIDIYIPELNLGFEFNGLYWHSEIYKERTYHLDKTRECLNSGISLFHIWEDNWLYKQDIVKSMILNKIGKTPNKIFARKCEVKEINDNNLVRGFLDKNHIQGFVGSKIKIGLFFENDLVGLMTFGNLRKSLGQKSQEGSYEMLRFCNKLNTNVIGGASKLFSHFIKNYDVKKVISYSDSSRSDGNLYQKLNFKLQHETDPNYYWIVDGIRRHRFNFRKDKLVREGSDPNKTEIEIMNEKGFFRIFDCGSKNWIFYNS